MDTESENKTEEKQANGVINASEMSEVKGEKSDKKKKPWIDAGFKNRDEWRKAQKATKGSSSTKVETKSEATTDAKSEKKSKKSKTKMKTKSTEKSVKKTKGKKASKKPVVKAKSKDAPKAKKLKTTYMKKHKYPTTAAERRKSAERTAHFMKTAAKREEPNMDEKRILQSVRVGSTTNITKMSELFAGAAAKRKSKVRNALRWCVASKHFKRLGDGEYKRLK